MHTWLLLSVRNRHLPAKSRELRERQLVSVSLVDSSSVLFSKVFQY